ncbi:phosphoribosyltransferase-like protein [Burkholderia gladioli]|uniref:phosphoribosyltransferase-like protein n=1 Tax=Burkholderia gladioli TaxID=28095 RepID=UPI00264CD9B2|nr:hypothetical protein [Burkholderia gladioli]MDN7805145.1 hypothetical protein [Burkholderia gladioli]
MAQNNEDLINQIVVLTADYELGAPTPQRVHEWLGQIRPGYRDVVLSELAHVLSQTYIKKATIENWIAGFIKSKKIVGENPAAFWRDAVLLDIQGGGTSQRDMNEIVSDAVIAEFGFAPQETTADPVYVYVDDVAYSGSRLLRDVDRWAAENQNARLVIYTPVVHAYGWWKVADEFNKRDSVKGISWNWYSEFILEDRRRYTYSSDVLRPISLPENEAAVRNYVEAFRYPAVYRQDGSLGEHGLFSSLQARDGLEKGLLIAGIDARESCINFPVTHRPLGFNSLEMMGFGSTIVTYRNCPNNAPLALWAGYPWIPLFPRRNN